MGARRHELLGGLEGEHPAGGPAAEVVGSLGLAAEDFGDVDLAEGEYADGECVGLRHEWGVQAVHAQIGGVDGGDWAV